MMGRSGGKSLTSSTTFCSTVLRPKVEKERETRSLGRTEAPEALGAEITGIVDDVTQKSYALGRFTYDVCRARGLSKVQAK